MRLLLMNNRQSHLFPDPYFKYYQVFSHLHFQYLFFFWALFLVQKKETAMRLLFSAPHKQRSKQSSSGKCRRSSRWTHWKTLISWIQKTWFEEIFVIDAFTKNRTDELFSSNGQKLNILRNDVCCFEFLLVGICTAGRKHIQNEGFKLRMKRVRTQIHTYTYICTYVYLFIDHYNKSYI